MEMLKNILNELIDIKVLLVLLCRHHVAPFGENSIKALDDIVIRHNEQKNRKK